MLLDPEKAVENDRTNKVGLNTNNKKFYSEAEFKELEETLKKRYYEARLMFGVKNHPSL